MGGDERELRRHTWDLTRGRSPYLRLVILEKLDEVPDKLFADELRADDLRELGTGVGVADVVTDVGEGKDEDTTGAGVLTFTTTTPESISRLTSSAALWNMKRLSRSRTVCFTCARLRAAREVCLLGLGFQ